jgi:chemotaxis protein MotB
MDDGDVPTPRRQRADAPPRPPSPQVQAAGGTATQPGVDQAVGTTADVARPPTRTEREKAEHQQFEAAANEIRAAVRADPALADLARQLAIDQTPEGLRIQLLDEDRSPMFATGSSVPNDRARLLLQKVLPVLLRLPEAISLAGHTDAAPYRGGERSNWELSTERANATRRLLVDAGLPEARVRSVTGNADRDPLLPADPLAAANRRIAIVVLRGTQSATNP